MTTAVQRLCSHMCAGVQGALEEQQQAAAAAAAAATSTNAVLGRDGKEAKIEAMIARREGAAKRTAFAGWNDVIVMKKLDQ
eukprot:COSAG02_NODE_4391_length_5416_cov_14.139438_5_plen_81_part_00